MRDSKKVIIIGAGVAGLTAGCYLRMNGYATEIVEMGKMPGGVYTGWTRKGYTFDGCTPWVRGATPVSDCHRLWKELHAFDGREVVTFDEIQRIETGKGAVFIVHADLDRLAAGLKMLAPADRGLIDDFIADTKRFAAWSIPAEEPHETSSAYARACLLLRRLPAALLLGKYRHLSIRQFTRRFSDPLLRELFISIAGSADCAVIFLMELLAWFHLKAVGYPHGGPMAFARAIEQRYLGLGGKVHYGARAASVVVRNDAAVGVELTEGVRFPADVVVSAVDGNASIFRLLGGKYADQPLIDGYNDLKLFPSVIRVSLGVAKRFAGPFRISLSLERPLTVDSKTTTRRIDLLIYHFDPARAPDGNTVLAVQVPASYEYWQNLRNNFTRKYLMEKERIANEVIGILDRRLGDVAAKVEVFDVATPATYFRYTNCWRGSHEGRLPTPAVFGKKRPRTLPGLDNFYLAGQWVEPGGSLSGAARSARQVARLICENDGVKFSVQC